MSDIESIKKELDTQKRFNKSNRNQIADLKRQLEDEKELHRCQIVNNAQLDAENERLKEYLDILDVSKDYGDWKKEPK